MDSLATSNPSSFPNAEAFIGVVEDTVSALRLVHAARLGIIPRIIRRLSESERQNLIVSGAVLVFSVEESGIRRWTDGRFWSPSRIVGNFLVSNLHDSKYREIGQIDNPTLCPGLQGVARQKQYSQSEESTQSYQPFGAWSESNGP